jgi:hypothetical protein
MASFDSRISPERRVIPIRGMTRYKCRWMPVVSVATAIVGVFANFVNKIDKITEKLKDVNKAKSRGVSCQH